MDGLANNPLFTADESDDDQDRKLALSSALPRLREKNLQQPLDRPAKKKAPRPGSQAVQGNKLFGAFDLSKLVGADEVALQLQQEAVADQGGDLLMEPPEGERRRKQLDWESLQSAEPRRMDEERKKSVEKFQKDKLDEESKRYLQGMQFHKDILTRTNRRPGEEDAEDEIEIEGESKYFFNKVKDRPADALPRSNASLAAAAGVPNDSFKRSQPPTPLIRDREDLRRVLKTTVARRAHLTEEDQKRLNVETNFTNEDEQEESKLAQTEAAKDEDYHPEVDQQIKAVEKMLLSDEEQLEADAEDSDFGNGLLQEAEEDWNDESQIERNEKNMRQEPLSPRADGEEEEDADYSEGDSEQSGQDEQSAEAQEPEADQQVDQEDSHREEDAKILVRLKRQKDVKEARREKKRARRLERMLKYAEEQKKRKQVTRNNDIFDAEADLGEVVDGRDAGLAAIDVV